MITAETIQTLGKENIADFVPTLQAEDIALLAGWLAEKDDNFRYTCFLLLQARSQAYADVYPYWDVLVEKLGSENSYQRSIGLMLIAENVRWDAAGRFEGIIERYLNFCDDEKPITVRQCVQSLCKIVPYKPACHDAIVKKLTAVDLHQRKETQRKILLLDILSVLCAIQKFGADPRIEGYIQTVLTGEILDKKAKKLVAEM